MQVAPLTRTIRKSGAEVTLHPDTHNGLNTPSAAQCQHIRSVAIHSIGHVVGNTGPISLRDIREILAIVIDV